MGTLASLIAELGTFYSQREGTSKDYSIEIQQMVTI